MDTNALWRWAEEHHGLVRTDEVLEAGLSIRARRRLEGADLERLSPRVARRVGSPRTPHQAALAAVLDAGAGAVLAGFSGGWLWRAPSFSFIDPVELTRERGRSRTNRPFLGRVKERRALPPHHVTTVDAIPVLTLPVLLYQLAGMLRPERFERVADTIVGRSPGVLRTMHDLLPELAVRGRNGITVIRAYLDERPPGARVPTGLERRFEQLVGSAGMKPLVRQVDVGGHSWIGRVDYLDADIGLIVEIQSATYHSSHVDRRADDARVEALLAAGFAAVLRIDEDVVWYRPSDAIAAVRDARASVAGRFVRSTRTPGVRVDLTKRERMSA